MLVVVDQPNTIGALPITVARSMGITVVYLPGLAMRRAADLYPGNTKTDAKDAFIIADTARTMPHTLHRVDAGEETLAELKVLVGFDEDLAAARGMGHSSSTTKRASFRRARGVRAALEWAAWNTGRPLVVALVLRQLHSTTGDLPRSTPQTESSHRPDQRAWTSQRQPRRNAARSTPCTGLVQQGRMDRHPRVHRSRYRHRHSSTVEMRLQDN